MKTKIIGVLAAAVTVAVFGALVAGGTARGGADGITEVDPTTLTCAGNITFDDVAGGGGSGTNYDAIFESDGANFAERFVGQTQAPSGDHDVISGSPSGPLALQIGAANQNLNVFFYTTSQVLTGLGPVGFPAANAIGEGSFAVLFDFDQSEFGFEFVGGDGGSADVSFYRRDGSLIETITLSGLGNQSYGFSRDGGTQDVAGVLVQNTDAAGIGFDNLCHDEPGVPDVPTETPTPEPTSTPTATPTATATPARVTICHHDRNKTGPNAGPHSITISVDAVAAHLRNHVKKDGYVGDDYIGECVRNGS